MSIDREEFHEISPGHSDVKGSGISRGEGAAGKKENQRWRWGGHPEPREVSVSRSREHRCIKCYRWTVYNDTNISPCGFQW